MEENNAYHGTWLTTNTCHCILGLNCVSSNINCILILFVHFGTDIHVPLPTSVPTLAPVLHIGTDVGMPQINVVTDICTACNVGTDVGMGPTDIGTDMWGVS